MSKRYIFPQQYGERKKAKLDISISDHNFPLSQNSACNKESDQDNWGDENDDELLLLASQAFEQSYNNNDSGMLPDYSICMQPISTSTQMYEQPKPSTSKSAFEFKKPISNAKGPTTTILKEKCDRISSPLSGISSKMVPRTNGKVNVSDELIINANICNGQDSEHLYRQLLKLQEENANLKSENGKLLDKCVTKEGEASILRTQLKSCQAAVDNARLDKIKEKVQMEWTEKLSAANAQMQDLRTQLDFKNLEIMSIKEKCKQSTKMGLTQVTVGPNDITLSHRPNSVLANDAITTQGRRVKTSCSSAQTENKAHFLKLNKTWHSGDNSLKHILPLTLEPTTDKQYPILDYNEKLQKHTDLSHKCRVFSTFHRVPSTPVTSGGGSKCEASIGDLCEDITCIVMGKDVGNMKEKYSKVLSATKSSLTQVQAELEVVAQRCTNAFQREMDERYIESTSTYIHVDKLDLLRGRALYKEEQAILARRLTAILAHLLEYSRSVDVLNMFEHNTNGLGMKQFVEIISGICTLIDNNSCATLYSGLLLSIATFIEALTRSSEDMDIKILAIVKSVLTSRPMLFVSSRLLTLMSRVCLRNCMDVFCPGSSAGNLKLDYEQGVFLFRKDSCYFQVLLKQIESCLKCIENQNLTSKAIQTTRDLMFLYNNINNGTNYTQNNSRCGCQLELIKIIVYALRICAVMLKCGSGTKDGSQDSSNNRELLAICRCGVQLLYQCVMRDVEFGSQLQYNEGHLIEFCERMKEYNHSDVHTNMLSELAGTLQSSPEDTPPSFHRQPWVRSFESFTLAE